MPRGVVSHDAARRDSPSKRCCSPPAADCIAARCRSSALALQPALALEDVKHREVPCGSCIRLVFVLRSASLYTAPLPLPTVDANDCAGSQERRSGGSSGSTWRSMLGHLGLGLADWRQSIHPFGLDETRPGPCRDIVNQPPNTTRGEPHLHPGEKVTGRPMAQDRGDTRSMIPFPCQGRKG